jgi:hypothetical protein
LENGRISRVRTVQVEMTHCSTNGRHGRTRNDFFCVESFMGDLIERASLISWENQRITCVPGIGHYV